MPQLVIRTVPRAASEPKYEKPAWTVVDILPDGVSPGKEINPPKYVLLTITGETEEALRKIFTEPKYEKVGNEYVLTRIRKNKLELPFGLQNQLLNGTIPTVAVGAILGYTRGVDE